MAQFDGATESDIELVEIQARRLVIRDPPAECRIREVWVGPSECLGVGTRRSLIRPRPESVSSTKAVEVESKIALTQFLCYPVT